MYLSYDGIVFDMVLLEGWNTVYEYSQDGCDFLRLHHIIDVKIMVNPALNAADTFPVVRNDAEKENKLQGDRLKKLLELSVNNTVRYFEVGGLFAAKGLMSAIGESPTQTNRKAVSPTIAPTPTVAVAPGTVGVDPPNNFPAPRNDQNSYSLWYGVFEQMSFLPALQNRSAPVANAQPRVGETVPLTGQPQITANSSGGSNPAAQTAGGAETTPVLQPSEIQLKPVDPQSPAAKLLEQPSSPEASNSTRLGRLARSGWEGIKALGRLSLYLNPTTAPLVAASDVVSQWKIDLPLVGDVKIPSLGDALEIVTPSFLVVPQNPLTVTWKTLRFLDRNLLGDQLGQAADSAINVAAEKVEQQINKTTQKLRKVVETLLSFLYVPQDFTPAPKAPPAFRIEPPKNKPNAPPPPNPFQKQPFKKGTTFPITANELRQRLSMPRRVLAIWINSGDDGAPQYILYQPFPGALVDALHGPVCHLLATPEIHGNVTGVFRARFECWEAPINGYTAQQAASAKLDPALAKRLLKKTPPILSNRWTMSQRPDPNTYLNTTVIEGRVVFRMDALKEQKLTADQLRPFIMPPIPFGYVRQPASVTLSSGGDEVGYTVVDQQQFLNNPGGLRWGVHSVIANQEMSYNNPIDFIKTAFSGMPESFDLGANQLKDIVRRNVL